MKRAVLASSVAAFVWLSGQSDLLAQAPSRISRMVQGIGPSGGVIPSGPPSRHTSGSGRSVSPGSAPQDDRSGEYSADSTGAESAGAKPWYKRLNPFAKSAPASTETREAVQEAPVIRSTERPAGRTVTTPLRSKSSRRAQASLDDSQPGNLFGLDRVRATADEQVERVDQTARQAADRADALAAEQARQLERQQTRVAEQTQAAADNVESYLNDSELVPLPRSRRVPFFSAFGSAPVGSAARRPAPQESERSEPAPSESVQSESARREAATPENSALFESPRDVAAPVDSGRAEAGDVASADVLSNDAASAQGESDQVGSSEVESAFAGSRRGEYRPAGTDAAETAVESAPFEAAPSRSRSSDAAPIVSAPAGTTAMPPVMDGIDTRRPMRPRGDVVNRVSVEEPAYDAAPTARRRAERPFDESAEQPVGHSVLPVAGSKSRPAVRQSAIEQSEQPASTTTPTRTWRQKWKSWFGGEE